MSTANTLTVRDETPLGQATHELTLDFLRERITVRELIRERVYEEVRQFNAAPPGYFRGLVQPTDAEATLNGFRLREQRLIDWEEQFRKAVAAFEKNGFFVLVDDQQVESLEDVIGITPTTQVSFVRLVALVGG